MWVCSCIPATTLDSRDESLTRFVQQSYAGPYLKRGRGDATEYAFVPGTRHLNPVGVIHGGCLVTFLDTCMGWVAMRHAGCDSVTIQLDTHFLKSVTADQTVICRAAAVKTTRSVVFLRGDLSVDGEIVMTGLGVWKNLRPGPAAT